MTTSYLLDTPICALILRNRPEALLVKLQEAVSQQNCIFISVLTYAALHGAAIGKTASAKHADLLKAFTLRLDGILPWEVKAAEATNLLKSQLNALGTSIEPHEAAIAGHAIATHSVLITNNVKGFSKVEGLIVEEWA